MLVEWRRSSPLAMHFRGAASYSVSPKCSTKPTVRRIGVTTLPTHRSAVASASYSSHLHLRSRTCTSSQIGPNLPPVQLTPQHRLHVTIAAANVINRIRKNNHRSHIGHPAVHVVASVLTESHVPYATWGEYASNIAQTLQPSPSYQILSRAMSRVVGKACCIATLIGHNFIWKRAQ